MRNQDDFPHTDFQHLALSYKMPLEVRNSSAFKGWMRLPFHYAVFDCKNATFVGAIYFLPVAAAETGLSMDLRQLEWYFKLGLLEKSLEFHRSVENIKHINIFKCYIFIFIFRTVKWQSMELAYYWKKSLNLKCC